MLQETERCYYDKYRFTITFPCRDYTPDYVAISEIYIQGNILSSSNILDYVSISSPVEVSDIFHEMHGVAANSPGSGAGSYNPLSFLLGNGYTWYYYDSSSGTWQQTTDLGSIPPWLNGMEGGELNSLPSQALDDLREILPSWKVAVFMVQPGRVLNGVNFTGARALSEDDIQVSTDSSGEYVPVTVTFTLGSLQYFPQDLISSYEVDFGDGETSGNLAGSEFPAEIEHEYQEAGTFQAVVAVTLTDGESASKTLEINVLPRADASLVLSSEVNDSQSSFAPIKYQFSAEVDSADERNTNLADTGVTWTIEKNSQVIDTFESQPLYLEYEFQEGGDYTIRARATSTIETHMDGELNRQLLVAV